jgi:2-haloacid dehalogenase
MSRVVVFDIGGVLVRWDPRRAFCPPLANLAEAEAFMTRADFAKRNLRADGGETWADLAAELGDPADRALLALYPVNFAATLTEPIAGTWELLDALAVRGHAIHAITNWSAETWPTGVFVHPRLGTAFGVTVVSGQERLLKPDPAIFARLCAKANVAPQDCLFIDDSVMNAEGARAAGMDAHHFATPEDLREGLIQRGLL